jgi:hypothetical protein
VTDRLDVDTGRAEGTLAEGFATAGRAVARWGRGGPTGRRSALEAFGVYVLCILGAIALSALLVSATGGSARAVFTALVDGGLRSRSARSSPPAPAW